MGSDLEVSTLDRLDELWFDAQTHLQERKYDLAINSLKAILRIDKQNASAYNRLAIIYAKQQRFRLSIRAFKKAYRYEPSAAANHNLGLVYYELENYKASTKYFERALAIDSGLAPRHIAMAKVQEKLGNESGALKHLKAALALEDNKKLRGVYVDTLSRYRKGKGLSEEMIEALKFNKIPWAFETLDDYEYAAEVAIKLQDALYELVHSVRNKKLTPRSSQTHELGVIFLHDSKASLELIHKNYSHAALNVARSMHEIYLRISFALKTNSYRGYAEIEKTTLLGKLDANQRLLKKFPASNDPSNQLTLTSRAISIKIKSLDRRYPNLSVIPSYRNMAIQLDNNVLGKHYELFVALYDKGSDSTHAEKGAVERIVGMSGTKRAGLFVDSYDLTLNVLKLLIAFGYAFLELPEISETKRKLYKKHLAGAELSLAKLIP